MRILRGKGFSVDDAGYSVVLTRFVWSHMKVLLSEVRNELMGNVGGHSLALSCVWV